MCAVTPPSLCPGSRRFGQGRKVIASRAGEVLHTPVCLAAWRRARVWELGHPSHRAHLQLTRSKSCLKSPLHAHSNATRSRGVLLVLRRCSCTTPANPNRRSRCNAGPVSPTGHPASASTGLLDKRAFEISPRSRHMTVPPLQLDFNRSLEGWCVWRQAHPMLAARCVGLTFVRDTDSV